MSDHRERTVSDISLKVGASSQAVSKALGDMKRAGLLSGDQVDGATMWRSAV